MSVKKIPTGYEGATPYLCCKGAAQAIEFYKKAFGATELFRIVGPGGAIGHAQVKIGGGIIMLADEYPDKGFLSPKTVGGTPVQVYIYVEDVDALAKRAIAAGITVTRPLANQFYGDRTVAFQDPFGHRWAFATHIEDVSPEEVHKRAAAKFGAS